MLRYAVISLMPRVFTASDVHTQIPYMPSGSNKEQNKWEDN